MNIDIGTVRLRAGKHRDSITVSRTAETVDIHFNKSSEGEALIRLPPLAAQQLGELLMRATLKEQI